MRDRTASISKNVAIAARSMRRAIDSVPPRHLKGVLDGFPEGNCKPASQLLARYLVTVAKVPMVRFVRGRRQESEFCKEGWQSHVWLDASGWIVDITADQYDEVKRKTFVLETSEWHDTFQTQNYLSYGEMLRMDGEYAHRFEHTYRHVVRAMHAPSTSAAKSVAKNPSAGSVADALRDVAAGITMRTGVREAASIAFPGSMNLLGSAIRRGLGWDPVPEE